MISFVIPAYNEQDNITQTIQEIIQISQKMKIEKYEVLVIDDHSSDDTFRLVENLKQSNINVLRLSRRSGSHVALRLGIKSAKGDCVICISADGQDDPAAIGKMIEKWRSGSDIVWALRINRENESFLTRIFAWFFYLVLRLLTAGEDNNIDLARADFYLLNRKVMDAINSCNERNTSLFGLIIWLGFKQDYIEYERRERKAGKSKWNFKSRLKLAFDWIVAFSGIPLKITTLVGFIFSALGILFSIHIIISFYFNAPIEGWTSLMVAVLIIGGIQMIMLGILGEYLLRSLDEARKRPLYFVEKSTLK